MKCDHNYVAVESAKVGRDGKTYQVQKCSKCRHRRKVKVKG